MLCGRARQGAIFNWLEVLLVVAVVDVVDAVAIIVVVRGVAVFTHPF